MEAPDQRALHGARRAASGRVTEVAVLAPLVLAFQVWDGFGWAAKAVFTWRMLHQWVRSEREGKSVLPAAFWGWSLLGSCLDLVYLAHRRDPVFMSGTIVNAAIYVRSFWMSRSSAPRAPGKARLWVPLAAGVVIFGAVVYEALGPDHGLVHFKRSLPWLVVGYVGTLGWTGRFVVQWWESERTGVAHLPAAFFYVGVVAAAFLFAYALHERDWVNTFGFGLTLVPYARNLVLMRRRAAADARPDDPGSADARPAAPQAAPDGRPAPSSREGA